MTTGRKTAPGKRGVKKLKLKKEEIRDLDVKKGKQVKGGYATQWCKAYPPNPV